MNEQPKESTQGLQETANQTGTTPQQLPAAIPKAGNAVTAQPATAKQLQQAEENIENRMSAFERTTVRLTTAGVIIGVITLLIFAGQLYEMIEGGTATDKLVDYAKTQANASSDQADAAHSSPILPTILMVVFLVLSINCKPLRRIQRTRSETPKSRSGMNSVLGLGFRVLLIAGDLLRLSLGKSRCFFQ